MNDVTYKTRVKRLEAVNKVISKLDPAIRSAAFELLQPYIVSTPSADAKQGDQRGQVDDGNGTKHADDADLGEFLGKHKSARPADALWVLTAFHYSEYGSAEFSTKDLKRLATDGGLTIPDRFDVTLATKKYQGKNLFKRGSGKGTFSPTVSGELFFKTKYSVAKGRKQKATAQPAE